MMTDDGRILVLGVVVWWVGGSVVDLCQSYEFPNPNDTNTPIHIGAQAAQRKGREAGERETGEGDGRKIVIAGEGVMVR